MFRLQIISTGEYFVMGDEPLAVDIQSSLFNNPDEFLGSKSYPGKILLAPNRALIENGHYINSTKKRRMPVRMWLGETPWKQAVMEYKIESKYISYELKIDGSTLIPLFKRLKLHQCGGGPQDVPFFPDYAAYYAYMNQTVTAAPGTMPVLYFPYKNEDAYSEFDPADKTGYLNVGFPVSKYMNRWEINATTGVGKFSQNIPASHSQTHTPFWYLVHVIKRVLERFGYKLIGKWQNDAHAKRIVIFSNVSDLVPYVKDWYAYMPDMLVTDFFKMIRTDLGVLVDFDDENRHCLIEDLRTLQSGTEVQDLRDAQQEESLNETGESPEAYKITRGVDDDDKAWDDTEKSNLPVLVVGEGDADEIDEVQLFGVATKMITEISPADSGTANWRIPLINMPVYPTTPLDQVSNVEPADIHKFKPRLLYWHGMVKNAAGYFYPYGSYDNLDKDNAPLTKFTLSLTIEGATFSRMQQYFNYRKNSKPFEMDFELNREQLFRLRAQDKVIVRDFDQSSVYCFFDVVKADLGKGNLYLVKITLWPDIQPDNVLQPVPDPLNPPIITPPIDNGVVYLKMKEPVYVQTPHQYPAPPYYTTDQDVTVLCFADAAGTIPKDVVDLDIRIKVSYSNPVGTPPQIKIITYKKSSINGVAVIFEKAPQRTSQGGDIRTWFYDLEQSADYHLI